jgi:short-subunit dehydrogenase
MVVVISGGSRGIGKSLALKFAKEGHKVILSARSAEHLADAKAFIISDTSNKDVHTFCCDLSDKKEVERFAAFCLTHGTPDILINNAGNYLPGNCIDEPDGTMESMLNINFFSAYYLTRALLPSMITKKSGHVFNMCSIASLKAYKGGGSYSVSKFALNGFSQNLRQELMHLGIKVTAVFPGAVNTDTWGGFDNSTHRIMEAEDITTMIFAATQLSATAVVEEITIRPQLGDL